MILKKLVGWPTSQACYYIGHWAYLVLDNMPDADSEEPGRVWRFLWRIYQGGMGWSWRVNDWAGCSIWSKPEKSEVKREGDSRG